MRTKPRRPGGAGRDARRLLRFLGKNRGRISSLLILPHDYRGMRWALCTGRCKGGLHASLRAAQATPSPADVLRAALGGRGGAGGHGTIAGGRRDVGSSAGRSEWRRAEASLEREVMRGLRLRGRSVERPFRDGRGES